MLKIGELYKIQGPVWLNDQTSKKLNFTGHPIEMSNFFMLLDFPKNYPAGPSSVYYAIKILFKNEIRYVCSLEECGYEKSMTKISK